MQNKEKDQKMKFKFSCSSERQIAFLRFVRSKGPQTLLLLLLLLIMMMMMMMMMSMTMTIMSMTITMTIKDKHLLCVMTNDPNKLAQKSQPDFFLNLFLVL